MNTAYAEQIAPDQHFVEAREKLSEMEAYLRSPDALVAEHGHVEGWLDREARELTRRLLHAHFALRGCAERRITVVGNDGLERGEVQESGRHIESIFGTVGVPRLSYHTAGRPGLRPLDALSNLPTGLFSHGVRWMVGKEVAQSSFDEVVARIRDYTGADIAKRQVEELAALAACDFDAFYATRGVTAEETNDPLVLTTDGKGIVMLHEYLREGTRRRAEQSQNKLSTRLNPGEKNNRKRMAQVASVYTAPPFPRTAADVVHSLRDTKAVEKRRPRPVNKRVWASVEKEPRPLIRSMFEEALRRDPERRRRWVVLVDGDPKQLKAVRKEAARIGVKITVIVDFIHVVERIWDAARALFGGSTPEAESWVGDRLLALLEGASGGDIVRRIRWWAKQREDSLDAAQRKAIRKACGYLSDRTRTRLMRYSEALRDGLPIATGVIEGACRYLVKDRMGRTGARWSLDGAEAVLRLRALWASGDLEQYWQFHLAAEKQRNHAVHYAGAVVPSGALTTPRPKLRVVK